jgi:hypothetical protein
MVFKPSLSVNVQTQGVIPCQRTKKVVRVVSKAVKAVKAVNRVARAASKAVRAVKVDSRAARVVSRVALVKVIANFYSYELGRRFKSLRPYPF